jgi:hypothetical protein
MYLGQEEKKREEAKKAERCFSKSKLSAESAAERLMPLPTSHASDPTDGETSHGVHELTRSKLGSSNPQRISKKWSVWDQKAERTGAELVLDCHQQSQITG